MRLLLALFFIVCSCSAFSQTTTTTTTTSSSGIDLSSPPLALPTPETTPAPSDILSPLTSVINQFAFTLPAHQSSCFVPTITVLNQDFLLDQPCNLILPYESFLNLVGVAMWALAAFLIIMSA